MPGTLVQIHLSSTLLSLADRRSGPGERVVLGFKLPEIRLPLASRLIGRIRLAAFPGTRLLDGCNLSLLG